MTAVREHHPFQPFLPARVEKLIVGSFPIGKFTNPARKSEFNPATEIDFYYGGDRNLLWKLVGQCFDRKFSSKEEIVSFLTTERIGVVDVVQSCERQNGSAADSALKKIEFNPAMEAILKTPSLRRILFTSKLVNHWFLSQRTWHCAAHVEQLVLLSPSPQVSIYISGTEEFKRWKESNPEGDTRTFRLLQYRSAFAKLNEKPNAD